MKVVPPETDEPETCEKCINLEEATALAAPEVETV